ncbi:MAG: hypothetical protein ACI95C_003038, partial [Pseudohongiellaceae bacterium]
MAVQWLENKRITGTQWISLRQRGGFQKGIRKHFGGSSATEQLFLGSE